MNSDSPITMYERACRRSLEVQAITDLYERIRQSQELKTECAAAFACLHANADSTDPEVWFALGDAYSKGWGSIEDRDEDRKWFLKAAKAGHRKAMLRLGTMLNRPAPDGAPTEAVTWFRRAAALGEASAMIHLGFAYREGTGVVCDNETAVEWFIKAVEAGAGHSMIHVGRMYALQFRAPEEALKWFLRAAEAGYKESYVLLALLYENRKSTQYDAVQAVHWYRRVAEGSGGSKDRAMLALAHFCRNGEGTAHDPAEAKAWLVKVIESAPPKSAFHREAKALLPKWETEML